jgi:hypothetical protein
VAPLNELDALALASVTLATMNSTHVVQHTFRVCNFEVPLEPQILRNWLNEDI